MHPTSKEAHWEKANTALAALEVVLVELKERIEKPPHEHNAYAACSISNIALHEMLKIRIELAYARGYSANRK